MYRYELILQSQLWDPKLDACWCMVACDNRGIQYITEMKSLLQSLFKKESIPNLNILNMPFHTLYMNHHHLTVDTFLFKGIHTEWDSNPRPSDYKSRARTTTPQSSHYYTLLEHLGIWIMI